jgi:hypothetical protein
MLILRKEEVPAAEKFRWKSNARCAAEIPNKQINAMDGLWRAMFLSLRTNRIVGEISWT